MSLTRFVHRCLLRATRMGVVGLLNAIALVPQAYAGGVFTQIVLPFDTVRPYEYVYEKAEHALVLALKKTAPSELTALEHYDERVIRRVLIKDLGPAGTEVKLILKNKHTRAVVGHFEEPFRVTVDLFDADYTERRDPVTGMPLASSPLPSPGAASSERAGKLLLAAGDEHESARPAPTGHEPQSADSASPRRLLQPTPRLLTTPGELNDEMRAAPEGRGKAWAQFPPYVYRMQTAAYEAGLKKKVPSIKDTEAALSSAEAMAHYAGKLFDLGDESRALIAYQQVLHKEPAVFERDALHLWKFAEIHLGQGNLTLASGYFEALAEKHPESPLAGFAKLRALDVAAIRLLRNEQHQKQVNLLERLALIKPRGLSELSAQLGIRKAYWDQKAHKEPFNPLAIPEIEAHVRHELADAYNAVENPQTGFIAGSLLLKDLLKPEAPWQRATGQFAEAYLKRFNGERYDPYREELRTELYNKINHTIQTKVADGKLLEATGDYEALPRALRSVDREPRTAWSLGEAYRKLGQQWQALDHYKQAAKEAAEGPERFKAQFWLAVTSGEVAALETGNQARAGTLKTQSRDADRNMEATWKRLKDDEKNTLLVAYKSYFEDAVTSASKLRTPAKIVLTIWKQALQSRASTSVGSKSTEVDANLSPSGAAVVLLGNLGKRFGELGLVAEKREAQGLMQHIKPSELGDDQEAKNLWRRQLTTLAEEYRDAGQYLEAGRLYALVGDQSSNWEGRAETLYKGGLLLYRSGRRQEAVDAFRKAADDGNNLFYANLAKERLAQLE